MIETEESEIDLRHLLGLFRRQLRLILTVTALGLGLAVLALFVLEPIYTAESLVLVDPAPKNLLDPGADRGTLPSYESARVDSEVELARAETVLLATIAELNLISDPEFGVSLGLRDRLLAALGFENVELPTGQEALQVVAANLRDALDVERRGVTYLISIRVSSTDPERAASLSNAVSSIYIRNQLESKVEATLAARDIINSRIQDAANSVARSEDAFDGFISSNLASIASETGRMDLLDLNSQLDAGNRERARLSTLTQLAEASLARRDWSAVAEALQTDAVTRLEAQRVELERRLAGAAAGSDIVVDLRSRLDAVEDELADAATAELTSLRADVAETQGRIADLRNELRSTVLAGDLPAGVLTGIYELQQSAQIARSQYQTLLERLNDLEAQAYLQVADSRIVSEALPPADPSFPNARLMLAAALIGSLGLGIGLAFLVENYVGGLVSEEQLESVLRCRAVAAVPRQRALPAGAISIADLVTRSPLSVYAEAIRRIRIGIELAARRGRASAFAEPGKSMVVVVTSAVPEEGKTTLALSLARAFALSGKNTLLVDADLRKPSLHRLLGEEPGKGLLEYLARPGEKVTLPDIVTTDAGSGVQIVVGARRSDMPTDQLASGERLSKLVEAARDLFDVVILDTPPVGPVVDALYLASLADVIAFVTRWSSTSQREARNAVNALREAKQPETETVAVLNQQDSAKSGYRSQYESYYAED